MFNFAKRFGVVWAIVLGIAVISDDALANAACPKVGFTVVEPYAAPETRTIRVGKNRTIFVRREALTTTSDISDIRLVSNRDPDDDDGTLQIRFIPAADQRLHDATTNHSGMRIAFLFNDEVLINVVWQGPYGMDLGGSQVDIRHGLKKARELMKAIQGCTGATTGERTR